MGPGRELALRRRGAAISAGDQPAASRRATRWQHWLATVDDPWLHVRGEAMLGELARARAPVRRRRRAHRSRRRTVTPARVPPDRGVPGVEPRPRAVPGRRLRRRARARSRSRSRRPRRPATSASPRSRGCTSARAARARRRTAEARAALEAAGAWHRAAGGGEQAALGECLLAAMDAADGGADARRRGSARSSTTRDGNDDAPVEVFALDALARRRGGRRRRRCGA